MKQTNSPCAYSMTAVPHHGNELSPPWLKAPLTIPGSPVAVNEGPSAAVGIDHAAEGSDRNRYLGVVRRRAASRPTDDPRPRAAHSPCAIADLAHDAETLPRRNHSHHIGVFWRQVVAHWLPPVAEAPPDRSSSRCKQNERNQETGQNDDDPPGCAHHLQVQSIVRSPVLPIKRRPTSFIMVSWNSIFRYINLH